MVEYTTKLVFVSHYPESVVQWWNSYFVEEYVGDDYISKREMPVFKKDYMLSDAKGLIEKFLMDKEIYSGKVFCGFIFSNYEEIWIAKYDIVHIGAGYYRTEDNSKRGKTGDNVQAYQTEFYLCTDRNMLMNLCPLAYSLKYV